MQISFATFLVLLFLQVELASAATAAELKQRVKLMFQRTFDDYLKYAYPSDELKPLSCSGHKTLGDYSLTLIDSLDTLVLMGDRDRFMQSVDLIRPLTFDLNVAVSVFETNIRILGGLLSAHIMAQKDFNFTESVLLDKAIDLGNRLVRAFDTPTGMPYGTVNLRHGIPPGETPIVCVACTASYSMEFGWLSLLTGNKTYYVQLCFKLAPELNGKDVAKRAVRALWKHRSPWGLFASHIDATTGRFMYMEGGISGGIDSFYEYLVKAWIMFGDEEYGSMFEEAYHSAQRYVRHSSGWWVETDVDGQYMHLHVSSLVAFWPGMQVLFGDLPDAHKQIRLWANLLHKVHFIPELWSVSGDHFMQGRKGYPLRPEYIESLWYMHQATKEPLLRNIGEELLRRIETHCKTPCGYSDIKDVDTLEKADSMQSFFLSETLKYYYLLFSDDSEYNDGWIMTTEAHPLPITKESVKLGSRERIQSVCRPLISRRARQGRLDKNWQTVLLEDVEHQEPKTNGKQIYEFMAWISGHLAECPAHTPKILTYREKLRQETVLDKTKQTTCDAYRESPNLFPKFCNFYDNQADLSWSGTCPKWNWIMAKEWFFWP